MPTVAMRCQQTCVVVLALSGTWDSLSGEFSPKDSSTASDEPETAITPLQLLTPSATTTTNMHKTADTTTKAALSGEQSSKVLECPLHSGYHCQQPTSTISQPASADCTALSGGLYLAVGLSLLQARRSGTHYRPSFVVCPSVLVPLGTLKTILFTRY